MSCLCLILPVGSRLVLASELRNKKARAHLRLLSADAVRNRCDLIVPNNYLVFGY